MFVVGGCLCDVSRCVSEWTCGFVRVCVSLCVSPGIYVSQNGTVTGVNFAI